MASDKYVWHTSEARKRAQEIRDNFYEIVRESLVGSYSDDPAEVAGCKKCLSRYGWYDHPDLRSLARDATSAGDARLLV